MFVSSDAGCAGGAAGARRGAVRRRAARGAARFADPLRAALGRSLAAIFFDDFLLEALRDFAAVFAAFRRFLAMRAPPVEMGARILSDKLIARVLILRLDSLDPACRRCRPARVRRPGWRRRDRSRAPDAIREGHGRNQRIRGHLASHLALPLRPRPSAGDGVFCHRPRHGRRTREGQPRAPRRRDAVLPGPSAGPGAGLVGSPLFVRWNFPAIGNGAVRVFGEGSGSLLFTAEPVPVSTTTFNSWIRRGSAFASRKATGGRGSSAIASSTSRMPGA